MSLRLRLIPPQARQLVEMHQSVGNAKEEGKKKRERESARARGTSPMTTSEKPSSSSSSGSSFPPRAQRQRGCENHQENPQTFARRENKLQRSSGSTSSPGGIATTGEEWEG